MQLYEVRIVFPQFFKHDLQLSICTIRMYIDEIKMILNGKSKCDFLVLSGDKWREKNFCLVTNPRKKLKYRMFTEAES